MDILIRISRIFRKRIPEIYHRLLHCIAIFRKRFPGLFLIGRIDLPSEFHFEEEKASDRGREAPDGSSYSQINIISWEHIPLSIKQTIKNYDSILKLYLGDGYLINEGRLWRNHPIPKKYEDMDLYSNNWHYDNVFDFRLIQLLVLLDTVTEDDGPLEYVVDSDECKFTSTVIKRKNIVLENKIKKLTGVRGDSLLFSAGSTPHRAGIPVHGHFRDIFSIGLFPAYTKIGISSGILLKDLE